MASNLPAKPPDIDKLDSVQAIQPKTPEQMPEEGKFANLMNSKVNEPVNTNPPAQSPINLAAQGTQAISTPPTLATVQSQMQSVAGSLGDIKNQLHTKGLKLKQSEKYLLRSKLTAANANIRGVAERTGVNTGAPVNLSNTKNPITKFLELVSDGQNQLNSAAMKVHELSTSGKELNASQFLLIQAKLQKAQQELDFTSVLLGKATDTIKTLFNVQI